MGAHQNADSAEPIFGASAPLLLCSCPPHYIPCGVAPLILTSARRWLTAMLVMALLPIHIAIPILRPITIPILIRALKPIRTWILSCMSDWA